MNNNECDAIILSKAAEKIILALLESDEYQGKLASELLNAKKDIFVGSEFENTVKAKIAAYLQKEYADMFTSYDDILSEVNHICYVTEYDDNGEPISKPSDEISSLVNAGISLSADILKKIDGMIIDEAVSDKYDIKFALTDTEKEKAALDKTMGLIAEVVDKHMKSTQHSEAVEVEDKVEGDGSSIDETESEIQDSTIKTDDTDDTDDTATTPSDSDHITNEY